MDPSKGRCCNNKGAGAPIAQVSLENVIMPTEPRSCADRCQTHRKTCSLPTASNDPVHSAGYTGLEILKVSWTRFYIYYWFNYFRTNLRDSDPLLKVVNKQTDINCMKNIDEISMFTSCSSSWHLRWPVVYEFQNCVCFFLIPQKVIKYHCCQYRS